MSKRMIVAAMAVGVAFTASWAAKAADGYPVGFGPHPVLPQPHHKMIPT